VPAVAPSRSRSNATPGDDRQKPLISHRFAALASVKMGFRHNPITTNRTWLHSGIMQPEPHQTACFVRSQEQHDRWSERCQEPRDHDEQLVQISLARLLDCSLCVNTRELRALVPVLRDSRRVSDAMPDSSLLHSSSRNFSS